MRHRQPARHMPPSPAAARPSRTTAASFPLLVSLLVLGSAISVHAEEVKIGNVLAPRAALNFKGNTAWPYGLCEGDCDSDSDCTAGLRCYQRSGSESVPGCTGTARSDVDYCVLDGDGQNNDITDVGGDQDDDADLLARCEGDCDSDDECADGLVCYQRSDDEPVPRCNGSARTGWDYCVRESDLDLLEEMMGDADEEEVDEEEVEETPRPTMRPTMPPPGVVFGFPDGSEPDDMQRCHGDCDKDSDCASGLMCLQRNGKSPDEVPGCRGEASGGTDYCISPADLPPTPLPTMTPTRFPTMTPTRRPTLPPVTVPVPVTPAPTPKPVVVKTRPKPTVRSTPRPTEAPVSAPSKDNADANEAWLDLTPDDSAGTAQWVYLSPFELSLDFQTIRSRDRRERRRLLRAGTAHTSASASATTATSLARSLQQLSSLIDSANLEEVLGDIIGNKMGALSTGYTALDLDVVLKDEVSYDDGRITVTYDVDGNVGFDTADSNGSDVVVPTKERVRLAAEQAVQENGVLVRDLRRLGEEDLVLSSVQSTRVMFLEPANDGGSGGLLDSGAKRPASSGDGGENNLVEILVLVIIVVVCIGATALALLFVRKRRKEKAFVRDIERNRSKMERERSGAGGDRGGKSGKTPTKKSSGAVGRESTNTNTPPPPAKAPQSQRPPAQSTPPTPALTPPVGTVNVKKSRSLPQSHSASTKKQLFVKDTPAKAKQRKQSKKKEHADGSLSMPDPPDSDIEGGSDWSISATSMTDTGMDRALNSGLASLTSMENIDTDLDDANDTLGDANEDNTVSSLGGESLTFGGTAAGESIFGKEGINLDAILKLDEERSQSSMSELGDGSFGNRPRYRDRATAGAASRKKKSKVANKKMRRLPPQPSAAAQDLEGQVKAFEERVLGMSSQEELNLPARLRSDHE